MKQSSDPNTGKPAPVAWYADPQPILFDQIEVGQGALFTRDELPEPVPDLVPDWISADQWEGHLLESVGYDPAADAVRPSIEDYVEGFDGAELAL